MIIGTVMFPYAFTLTLKLTLTPTLTFTLTLTLGVTLTLVLATLDDTGQKDKAFFMKTMPSEIGFPTLTSDASLNQENNKQTSHE